MQSVAYEDRSVCLAQCGAYSLHKYRLLFGYSLVTTINSKTVFSHFYHTFMYRLCKYHSAHITHVRFGGQDMVGFMSRYNVSLPCIQGDNQRHLLHMN